MRILADHNIPLAEDFFSTMGAVETVPASAVSSRRLSDVDILLVRSVTSVNADLLEGSPVQFVGSATSGTNHVDLAYLQGRGIGFAHAPGANADSVVEYVLTALFHQCLHRQHPPDQQTVGLIGCGNIGSRLARRLPAFGFRIRCCDPFLAKAGAEDAGAMQSPISGAPAGAPTHALDFHPLDDVLSSSDVVTLHVPLHGPPHATHHLLNADTLAAMRPSALLINASRGAVADSRALMNALAGGSLAGAVLDVWENEPAPEADLIRRAALATPHIAGYSYDGKVVGTRMLYEAACRYFDVNGGAVVNSGAAENDGAAVSGETALSGEAGAGGTIAVRESAAFRLSPPDPALPSAEAIHWLIRQMYDIAADDRRMRPLADLPDEERRRAFVELRRQYPRRRTFSRFALDAETLPAELHGPVYQGLGIQNSRDATR